MILLLDYKYNQTEQHVATHAISRAVTPNNCLQLRRMVYETQQYDYTHKKNAD